jgi:hypothetical protein
MFMQVVEFDKEQAEVVNGDPFYTFDQKDKKRTWLVLGTAMKADDDPVLVSQNGKQVTVPLCGFNLEHITEANYRNTMALAIGMKVALALEDDVDLLRLFTVRGLSDGEFRIGIALRKSADETNKDEKTGASG